MSKKLYVSLVISLILVLTVVGSIGVMAYNEAPTLAKKVASGELEPVDQRLPQEPMVVTPLDSIGKYGGNWRKVQNNTWWWQAWEPLLKLDPKNLDVIPNLAKSYQANDEKTIYTFNLREGLKWSDGEPFTSADILFWFEDLVMNDEYSPSKPSWLKAGGEMVEVTAPDKNTVIFKFEKPNPLFIRSQAMMFRGGLITTYPKHYLSQFHPEYADQDKLNKLLEENGVDSWIQLMGIKASYMDNPELPVMTPWVKTTDPSQQLQVMERNPYYWKVDTADNQLPYIDKISWQHIDDTSVRVLKGMNGEVDLDRVSKSASDMPTLMSQAEKVGYRPILLDMAGLTGASVALFFNQNYDQNEQIAALLQNDKFRKAISVAIDRDEVNEFVTLGLAGERQATISSSHPAFKEKYAKAYTEYDPEQANKLLDEIGLTEKNGEGYRLLPDGKVLTVSISASSGRSLSMDSVEIIKPQLEKIGIKVNISAEEGTLFVERRSSGFHQITLSNVNNGMNPISKPDHYIPVSVSNQWAPLAGEYYASNGSAGVEPTATMKKMIDLYEKASSEPNDQKRIQLIQEIMDIHAEELYMVGVIGYAGFPIVIHDRMKNVPKKLINAYQNGPTVFPEQYYIEE